MAEKRDHLQLCNEANIPMQEFTAGWCSRCFQSECTRSIFGKSKFDARVQNWEDRLFRSVPRIDPSDGRAQGIAKKFLDVPNQTQGASAWVDPRDLEPTKLISVPNPPPIEKAPVQAAVEVP